jgi:hypothetical protein
VDLSKATREAQVQEWSRRGVSNDEVVIELRDTDTTDLSLIDLPRYVDAAGDKEDPRLAADISSIVSRYIGNSRSILLAVVPAHFNFRNNRMLKEALRVDPQRDRAMVVATQADRVEKRRRAVCGRTGER